MKLGIVTFHRAYNYGALLQCVALYQYLKKCGHDVEIIDYRNTKIESRYNIFPGFRRNIIKYAASLFYPVLNYKKLKQRRDGFDQIRNSMKLSDSLSFDEIMVGNRLNYDVYISGSDQLWNPQITDGFDDVYFLQFKADGKKATYAMSMGNISLPEFGDNCFKNKVSLFDYISMRETDASKFVSQITGNDIPCVVDPTLLLNSDEWNTLITSSSVKAPDKYIFIYYVQENDDLIKMADEIADKYRMPIVYVNVKQNKPISKKFRNRVYNIIEADPYDFVKLIKNASFVVTSSFHATAFSCIYRKDIHMLLHSGTGSRVKSLASLFGIENRIYNSFDDFIKKYSDNSLNYNNEKYQMVRCISDDYINTITKL